MSQWWISPADGQVVVDDASIADLDTTNINPSVYLMFWHGTSGEILRKHSTTLPVRETFVDFTPYVPNFDRWIAAAASQSPAITLTQSKAVKSSMVQSLFEGKRQLPIVVEGGVYSATDTNMQTLMGGLTTDALIAAINSAIDQFNAYIDTLNAINLDLATKFNLNAGSLNTGAYLTAINTALASIDIGGDTESGLSITHTPMPPQSLDTTSVPSLSYFPHVTLGTSTDGKVVQAISARTTALNSVRTGHLSNVAAQGSVAAVAAYNILTGW